MIEVLLALTLRWTIPATTAPAFVTETGVVISACGATADSVDDVVRCRVWRLSQSATWVVRRDSMLSNPQAWSEHWPAVAREAGPQLIGVVNHGAGKGGTQAFFVVPDSLSSGTFFVTGERPNGVQPCWGNLVSH